MAEKQTIIIEEIAKVDGVLDGIKKIQKGFDGLSVPKDIQRQFEEIYKKITQQAEKAKQAASSGFETKGDVKKFNDALGTMVRLYGELETKAGRLSAEKLAFGDAKGLKDFDDHLKELKKDLDNAKQAAADFGDSIKDKVQAGFDKINSYKNKKSVFKEWSEAQEALYKNNDIEGFKNKIKEIGAEFEKIKGQGVDLEKSAVWSGKYKVFQEMIDVLKEYDKTQQEVITKDQEYNGQLKIRQNTIDATKGKIDNLTAATREATEAAQQTANSEREVVNETQRLNSELEHFKSKAAYFFGMGNAINLFKRAVRSAYSTVKDLDAVMTETAVVTPFSVSDMWEQLPEYTRRANELGVTIHDTYEAATLFYQQGLKTNEVMQISNETLKMARIAGLDAATASDRMTNALRGFNMELDKTNAQRVNDVYSKLAAITASNTDEISTAMTKVASLAHNANMEFETTAAFLAQIIESTRESAETAGTALKTVVARFSEVKKLYSKGELLGQDEEGEEIDVNKVSTALRSAGINLNEYLTGAKGLDDIFIELAEKWDSLDQVQQRYIATMAAGSRQQSRFIALMSDYKRTMQLVDAANNANGASNEQYGKTLESLQTKLARLKNAWNEFILGLANSDAIKGAVDLLTGLITVINNLIKTISGKNSAAKMITTFLTAFAGFKIGKKLFGGSALGNFFAGLVQDGNGQAAKGAANIARVFYDNLSTRIVKYGKAGGLSGTFDNIGINLINGFQNSFSKATPEMIASLKSHLDTSLDITPVLDAFKSGKYTLEEFNQVLKDNGQTYQLTADDAAKMGIAINNNNSVIRSSVNEMRTCATAAMALGGAFMIVGNLLENMDGPAKEFGTVLKYLGGGLMTFGTIMSVTLPLMAQVGAKGVTAAITSIPIVGWIALLITLLGALGAALYNVYKNNSLETKLKKSQEAAKNAAQAAEEAKEAYEKLGEAWAALEEKNNAIEEATEGTREWRDAIREVNGAVLELVESYGGLIKIERGENGALIITNQEEIDEIVGKHALVSEAEASLNRMQSYEDEEKVRRSDYLTSHMVAGPDKFMYNSGAAKVLTDYKDNLDALDQMTEVQLKKILSDAYFVSTDLTDEAHEGMDPTNPNYTKDITEIENFLQASKSSKANVSSEAAIFGSTALQYSNIAQNLLPYANNFLSEEILTDIAEKNKGKYDNMYGNSLKDKYALAAYGKSWKEAVDDNPELEKKEESEMRSYLETADALDATKKVINDFAASFENLTDSEKAFFAESEGKALTSKQIDELRNQDKTNLYDTFYKDFFDSQKEFEDWFNKVLETSDKRFNIDAYGGDKGAFSKLLDDSFNTLTSGAFQSLVENLWSVFSISGEEGMKEVQDSILKMMEKVEPDKVEDFTKAIAGTDWASVESVDSLKELAREYGISEEEIENLTSQLIQFNNAARQIDLEQINKGFTLYKKIASGEQGRSFSKEDYETAIANGANPGDFQYNIETESYDYIGQDIQEVADAIRKGANDIIAQLDKDYANAVAFGNTKNGAWGSVNGWTGSEADLGNLDNLKSFLLAYDYAAGENSLVSKDFIENATLEELQAKYRELEELYNNQADIQQDKNAVAASEYQATSAPIVAASAAEGDEIAVDVLKQQIANSGLSEAFIQALTEQVESGDAEQIKDVGNTLGVVQDANDYGIKTEDLEMYVEGLRMVDSLQQQNESTLIALAAANAKYQDGFTKIIESYNEWIELKQEDGSIKVDPTNLADLKAITTLKGNLQEMFGVSEEVTNEFLKMPGAAELLEQAVNGDTDAVTQLRGEIAKLQAEAKLVQLGIDPESQNAIMAQINGLMDEAGTLEFGATLDQSKFAQGLLTAMEAAGMTVAQMQEMFNSLGWAPELDYEMVDVADASQYSTDGYIEIVDPKDPTKTITVPTHSVTDFATNGQIAIPKIGNATFVPPSIPDMTPSVSTSSGGGGGGGGGGSSSPKEEKPSYWKNPYDELYNLNEKINESLRTREALERRYQKLLKQEKASLSDIRKSYYAQIQQLTKEGDLQRQLAAGRLNQINKLGSQLYTDSEGNRKTYSSMGATRYASYNAETGLLQIDWSGLEAIANDPDRKEEGEAAEAYISELEKLVSSYEEVRDKLWEIEDTIEQLRQEVIDSYLSFEDRVMDALVNRYQKEIDRYQAVSDALEKADNKIISAIREQIELSRQIRDNTKKEEDITDMENRLAYLRRDTSGANDLEILKLQQNLDDARQSFTDQLIDQAIDSMEKEAELAAEQRAKQIEIMQTQLDIAKENGQLWKEVHDIINDAAAGDGALSPYSNLVKLLEEAEAFKSMSAIGKEDWFEKAAEEFHKAWIGKDEAEDKYGVDANDDGKVSKTGTSVAIDKTSQPVSTKASGGGGTRSGGARKKEPEPEPDEWDDATIAGVAMNICGPNNGWGDYPERKTRLEEKGFNYSEVQSIVNDIVNSGWDDSYYREKYGINDVSPYGYYCFKTGGLANFTGPAWLDGTKSKPELVLNAQDTQNFVALKDILASLLNSQAFNADDSQRKGGDNYFDIDISANIGSDYDVDKLTEKIKKDIFNDGQYRNVNTINFLR